MKRKFADRPNWSRIIKKSYTGIEIHEDSFQGHLGYLLLEEVRDQLWVAYGSKRICIVDDGYVWLQHFPMDGRSVLTSTFDDQGELVQGYFDIVKTVGVTAEGIPYCDDLFLDVVALPNGEIYTLDEDELLAALKQDQITQEDFDFAYLAATELTKEIEGNRNYLLNATKTYYKFIKEIREITKTKW